MPTIRNVAALLSLVMVAAIVVGLTTAPEGEAGRLFENVWGIVSLVDLYLVFALVWGWIAWREQDTRRAVLWAVLLATLGAVAAWAYVAVAAARADSPQALLLGTRQAG